MTSQFIPQDVVQAVLGTIPNGQFFTVVFEKMSTAELRTMVCQKGVKKHVVGTGESPSKKNPDLQGVYEQNKTGYRSFNTKNVLYIKARGMEVRTTHPAGIANLEEHLGQTA